MLVGSEVEYMRGSFGLGLTGHTFDSRSIYELSEDLNSFLTFNINALHGSEQSACSAVAR